MNNSLIKKRLTMEPNSTFSVSKRQYFQTTSKVNRINHLLSKSNELNLSIDNKSLDLTKIQPKSFFNKTIYAVKLKENFPLFDKQFEPKNGILRTKPTPKDELKPMQTSKFLKKIEQKISIFTKNTPLSYQHKDFKHNTKHPNTTFIQKSKLQQMLRNRHNPQSLNQSQEKLQNSQKKQIYSDWYMKAIETHLKQNNQKIDLKYSTQESGFKTKIIHRQRQVGRTFYPKLSTGFKKRSVSYEVKYI